MNAGNTISHDLNSDEAELNRQLTICNACRYCESYCAVFPAMTQRLDFNSADMHYLANLCHNCGACLHACQYALPHEFAVNIPRAMARMRLHTYTDYAWPRALGGLYRRTGTRLALALGLTLSLILVLTMLNEGTLLKQVAGGNFYAILPHDSLIAMFGGIFGFAVIAITTGLRSFWQGIAPSQERTRSISDAILATTQDTLMLKNLGGGHGEGCNEQNDTYTLARRRFHHLTFYGFLLCFASTSVATAYHYFLGLQAPYAFFSVPVLLGTLGGLGLLFGPAGLLYLNIHRHPDHGDADQRPIDRGFILLLFIISLSGMLLLAMRQTTVMPLLLAIHLGFVMAFFLIMPYCKFIHGFYRVAALLKSALKS